ncbi:MAG TPA: SDR family oxidoreductase [Gaiellaceae bacterium]|nr:SDR family oxidoreductase [Gaiellaceae bacterium]
MPEQASAPARAGAARGRPEIVVVAGASAGVGRATVRRFARDGAHLGLLARGAERLGAAVREVEEAGGRAVAIPTDVSDPEAVEAAAARVEAELGPVDVWVNNAMATVYATVAEVAPDEFRRATEVTYLGSVWGTMSALRRMRPRDRGCIVQVGSALAYRGIPLQAAYCGAKHALQGFVESLRTELLHEGSNVHVTMVQLPALNTPQFSWARTKLARKPQPLPPIFQPEVAAEAIVWAARHRRRELHVGWPTVKTVAASKLAPGVADRYLARTGYESQQRAEPVEEGRQDNLFDPVSGDYGAHGEFDERSKARSLQLLLTRNREWLALAAGAGLAAAALLARDDA